MAPAASTGVSIVYVPAECGSVIPGKSKAPQAFRACNIVEKLRDSSVRQVDEHHALDKPATYSVQAFDNGSVRNEALNVHVCERVKQTVSMSMDDASTSDPRFQLVLGGECCILPAVLSAFWEKTSGHPSKRVGLLYIDADTDLNSPTDPNSSGNLAGMNMTHLAQTPGGLESMKQFSRPDGSPVCNSENMVLFGTNLAFSGNKREHLAYLFDNNYKVVTSSAVARDPKKYAEEALEYLEARCNIIVAHLDVDSIDPRMFPLANLPNFTGVSFENMMEALRVFMGSSKIGGLVIAEVNPDHDPELKMTERLTDEVVSMLVNRAV